MQEIWKAGLQWDELLPPEMQEKWTNLVRELQTCTHLPRRYFPMTNEWPKDTELHVFVDASLKAYGASAYVKSSKANHSSFAMAKSRVAPLKKTDVTPVRINGGLDRSTVRFVFKENPTNYPSFPVDGQPNRTPLA